MFRKPITLFFGMLTSLFVISAQADLNLADGTASGQWYNPSRNGEGFWIEISGEGENHVISVAMYSYDADGMQLWLVGSVGIANGDIGATVPVILVEGPVWGTAYDPADQNTTQFGTIVVRFPTCDSALFNVNSNVEGLESGSYSQVRLTGITGVDCTDPPQKPEGMVASGLWTGSGVCFFVNAEGTRIVESDLCDNGKAFSAEVPGVEIDIDGELESDSCQVNVVCDATWEIHYGDSVHSSCVNEAGGIGNIYFNSATDARVEVLESTNLNGSVCVGGSTATPAQ